jgi:hypothetical protein
MITVLLPSGKRRGTTGICMGKTEKPISPDEQDFQD